MERICQNCRLFNSEDKVCSVTILIEGQHYELPVLPNDSCHWERIDEEIQGELKNKIEKNKTSSYFRSKYESELETPIEIKQVRMWSNGKDGFVETTE